MQVTINIIDGPLPPYDPAATAHVKAMPTFTLQELSGAGAIIVFEGVVRPREGDRPIVALDYEAYEPMASRMLRELAEKILRTFDLLAVDVAHSRGRVEVGTCSFRLVVRSRHRKEGLAAMDQFIDQMKKDVPIWKTPVYQEEGA